MGPKRWEAFLPKLYFLPNLIGSERREHSTLTEERVYSCPITFGLTVKPYHQTLSKIRLPNLIENPSSPKPKQKYKSARERGAYRQPQQLTRRSSGRQEERSLRLLRHHWLALSRVLNIFLVFPQSGCVCVCICGATTPVSLRSGGIPQRRSLSWPQDLGGTSD